MHTCTRAHVHTRRLFFWDVSIRNSLRSNNHLQVYPGHNLWKTGTICFWPIAWLFECIFDLIPGCTRFWLQTDRVYPFLVIALIFSSLPSLFRFRFGQRLFSSYLGSFSCGYYAISSVSVSAATRLAFIISYHKDESFSILVWYTTVVVRSSRYSLLWPRSSRGLLLLLQPLQQRRQPQQQRQQLRGDLPLPPT